MRPRSYAPLAARPSRSRKLPWYVKFPLAYAIAGSFVLGALVVVGIDRIGLDGAFSRPAARAEVHSALVTARFDLCGRGKRITCVVDGDTFWLDGEKYRIADFNAPEVGTPSCPREAALGQRATTRLVALLNAAPFALGDYERDQDQYGRKLRIVMRDGRSIGDTMIAEGLAHPWRGKRESWC